MRLLRKLIPALLVGVFPLPVAQATTLARLSLDQLAAGADAVARVRCVSTESGWENDSIWTTTTAEVIETMKGQLPREITIRLPGGRAGHLAARVDGTPKFRPGDEAVLFLQQSQGGRYIVAGWVEGTFRIARDVRDGRKTVTQDSSVFEVLDPALHSFRREGIRGMPYDEFRTLVAASIARAAASVAGKEKTK